jgi:uncharacterized protein
MDYQNTPELSPELSTDSSTLPAWMPLAGAPVMLGRVVCISGSQIIIVLDPDVCGANASNELRKGTLVKMISKSSATLGIVTGLSIPSPDGVSGGGEVLLGEIDLVGECTLCDERKFRRGVSTHPPLGEFVYAANEDDLSSVYQSNQSAMIEIGSVYQADDRPAMVAVDGLLGKHFTVVGTTGAGKSCAVALLMHRLLDANSKAHIMLLDPHSEYAAAFGDRAEVLNPSNLELPYWLLNADELAEVIAGGRRDAEFAAEGIAILKEIVPQARKAYFKSTNPNTSDGFITVDTPIPFTLREVMRNIDEQMGRLEKSAPLGPFRWLKNRLDILRADSRYSFMFGGMTLRDNMADILARIFRIPVNNKPITIVDLSGMPSEVLNVVVSVLSRMTFDFALWSRGAVPILLVCEEAHRYAPADSKLGFEPTKQALARIAKEGRKYGASLAIITQRPSEIDPTILSQCNTLIAFRMTNTRDQDIVRGIVTDSAFGLLDFLPSLGNGDVIIAGEAVTIPQRVRLDHLPPEKRPRGATATFSKSWQEDSLDVAGVADIVDRWRRQVR